MQEITHSFESMTSHNGPHKCLHGVKVINRLAINVVWDISSLFSLSTKLVWISDRLLMQVSEIGGCCQTDIDVDYNEAFCSQINLRTLDILLNSIDILTPVISSEFDLLQSRSSPAERNNVPDHHHSHSPPLVQGYEPLRAYFLPHYDLVNEFEEFKWFATVLKSLNGSYYLYTKKKSCVASFTHEPLTVFEDYYR